MIFFRTFDAVLSTLQSNAHLPEMAQFVHLHVHTQYSLLDGQASVSALVDKAIADGMPGLAITDHGNMYGIKEYFNYVKKKKGKIKDAIKDLKKQLEEAPESEKAAIEAKIAAKEADLAFRPIFGCEMYVAQKDLHEHEIGRAHV